MGSQALLGPQSVLTGEITASDRRARRDVSLCGPTWRDLARAFTSLPLGTWVLIDLLLLVAGTWTGFHLFVNGRTLPYAHATLWQACFTLAATFVCASLVFGLYERETLLSRSRILTRTMLTTAATVVLTYAVIYVCMYTTLGRRVTGMGISSVVLIGGMARLVACYALNRIPRNLVLVGPGILSRSLIGAFENGALGEYRLVGYVDDDHCTADRVNGVPRLGKTSDLPEICTRFALHDIVVGAEAATDARVMTTVLPCLRNGRRVTNEATFFEKATGEILVDLITPHWFLFADLQVHCQRWQAMKRAFDLVVSFITMVLAAPLLPIIALLVKLDDGGPVFYSQWRVGQNGRPFRLFKFRTMRIGAENGDPVWAVKDDPRVTRVGRFLRRSRLDELPQLYNVLIGQMSLVGPRPERPDFVRRLSEEIPYYNERHLIKPGITGWAQIGFRYGSTIDDAKRKLQYDLYYLKNMTLELDAMILLRTLGVFVRGAC